MVANVESDRLLGATIHSLETLRANSGELDRSIFEALGSRPEEVDPAFRRIFSDYNRFNYRIFDEPKKFLKTRMDVVGQTLAEMWEDERYVREIEDVS